MHSMGELDRLLGRLIKEPGNARLFYQAGLMLCEANDEENAELYLRRAHELDPADKKILFNCACLLYFHAKWRECLPLFREFLKQEPQNRDALEKIRDSLYQLGEYDAAEKYAALVNQTREAAPQNER